MERRWYLLFLLQVWLASCTFSAREEDNVVIRFESDPESLNPINYPNANALLIVNLLYQSLLTVDLEDNQIKPLLVKSLPLITLSDSLSYFTYELRDEARWDNGAMITAYDVELSLKVINCPQVNNEFIRPRFDFIQDFVVDPENNRKFTFVCKGFNQEMELMTGDFFIIPGYLTDPDSLLSPYSLKSLVADAASMAGNPDIQAFADYFNSARFSRDKDFLKGSGGYQITAWQTGQFLILNSKENWWGNSLQEPLPYLTANPKKISFHIIPDNSAALLSLKNRQLDVFEGIPTVEFTKLQADEKFTENYSLFTPETHEVSYLGLNSRLKKFSDRRTRQALAHLVDLDNIIMATQGSFAAKTVGPISPANKTFYNSSLQNYELNPNQAIELLTQAGWVRKDGGWQMRDRGELLTLSLELNYRAGNTTFEHTALIFQQAAAAVGIPVTLVAMEGSLLSSKLRNHEFESFIRSFSGHPNVFDFKSILHTTNAHLNGANFTGFGNQESDSLIEAINTTRDEGQRALYLKRLQEILHEECTIIFLYFTKNRIAVSNRFTNLKISGIKPGFDVSAFAGKDL